MSKPTMLRWKRSQRAVLVAMLPELANLGIVGLVFGQVISKRAFSWPLTGLAIALWFTGVSIAIWLAGANES